MAFDPPDDDSAPPIHRLFATTHWTAVRMAGADAGPGAKEALEDLCRAYWYPLYAYVRRKGHADADAKDLTQQFFARLLQRDCLALADPARGRFRTFLLTALNHFLINEWIKTGREKRGGAVEFVPLHSDDPENLYTAEPADSRSPASRSLATRTYGCSLRRRKMRATGPRLISSFYPPMSGLIFRPIGHLG